MYQMEYVIGQIIRYVPASETLFLVSRQEDQVVLTPACNRLLLHLLSSQGTVLSRDAIFSVLWEQYGYSPSNSSLNTYVSQIRKAFIHLGLTDEIVITVPKVGFIFSPDVPVEAIPVHSGPDYADDIMDAGIYPVPETVNKTGLPAEENKILLTPVSVEDITPDVRTARPRIWVYPGLFAVVLSVFLLALIFYPRGAVVAEIAPVSMGQLNGCVVNYLPAHAGDTLQLSENQIAQIIRSSDFRCQPGEIFYFYADKNIITGHSGKIYVAACQLENARMTACRNYMNHHFILDAEAPVSE